jgi:hypothetical protein
VPSSTAQSAIQATRRITRYWSLAATRPIKANGTSTTIKDDTK